MRHVKHAFRLARYRKDREMEFPKTNHFDINVIRSKIMGPNTCKLTEELMESANIPQGSVVLDLGSGSGISSVMLAREYGFITYATDLWSDPGENMRFFESQCLTNREIVPVKADAERLPFAHGFFDAMVCVDSYNYFGRNPEFLDKCLLPYLKDGAELYLAISGMTKDCHDNLPACLLTSWTPEQLEYIHDMDYWHTMFSHSSGVEIVRMYEMACTREAWTDWIECDNEYAQGDRAAVEAGALDYLNTIAVMLRKRP